MRNIPPIIDAHLRYFEIFLMYCVAFENPRATNKNGTANPAENTVRSIAP